MFEFIIPLSKTFNIYFIRGKNSGKVPYTNALLIKDVLIDTGISPLYLKRLKRKFKINEIIFSHWHDDHIRDNKILEVDTRTCHKKAKPIIENIDRLIDLYDIRGTSVEPAFKDFLSNIIDVYKMAIDHTLKNDQIINIGDNLDFKVLYTPGHSVGHCSFYEPKLKLAFFGDIDLSRFGPWYGGLDSDIGQFKNSIERLKKLDIQIAITGHSGVYKGSKLIKKKLEEYKKIFDFRDNLILENLTNSKPLTAADLIEKNIIYKNYDFFKPFLLRMERTMIQKHLDKLLKEKRIEESDSGYIRS